MTSRSRLHDEYEPERDDFESPSPLDAAFFDPEIAIEIDAEGNVERYVPQERAPRPSVEVADAAPDREIVNEGAARAAQAGEFLRVGEAEHADEVDRDEYGNRAQDLSKITTDQAAQLMTPGYTIAGGGGGGGTGRAKDRKITFTIAREPDEPESAASLGGKRVHASGLSYGAYTWYVRQPAVIATNVVKARCAQLVASGAPLRAPHLVNTVRIPGWEMSVHGLAEWEVDVLHSDRGLIGRALEEHARAVAGGQIDAWNRGAEAAAAQRAEKRARRREPSS